MNEEKKKATLSKEEKKQKRELLVISLQMLGLYLLTAVVVYKTPKILGYVLFIGIFATFYKSKRDFFWMAYLFALCTGPGHFFAFSNDIPIGRLPFFGFGGINVSVTEILLGIGLYKSYLIKKGKEQIVCLKTLKILLYYCIFLTLFTMLTMDSGFIRVLKNVRYFYYYFTLIPLYYLVYRKGDLEKMLYCMFALTLVSLSAVLYFIFMGDYFIHTWVPGLIRGMKLTSAGGGARYSTSSLGSHLLLLFCYISALFLTFKQSSYKKKTNLYLLMVAGICYLIIMLTATRVWFVVFSFILIASLFAIKKGVKVLGKSLLVAILIYIPIMFIPKFQSFTLGAWSRIASIFTITQEDSIARQMIEGKKEHHLTKVYMGIEKSPIFGLGVSSDFNKHTSGGDVGNFDLILEVGILGFFFCKFLEGFCVHDMEGEPKTL